MDDVLGRALMEVVAAVFVSGLLILGGHFVSLMACSLTLAWTGLIAFYDIPDHWTLDVVRVSALTGYVIGFVSALVVVGSILWIVR